MSFGHAAFFGIGGYAAGILASHAFNAEPLSTWPFGSSGSDQMPVVWLVAMHLSAGWLHCPSARSASGPAASTSS